MSAQKMQRTNMQLIESLISGQIFLRERGPFIRWLAVSPDDRDRAIVAKLRQRHRDLSAPMPCPHDHHVETENMLP